MKNSHWLKPRGVSSAPAFALSVAALVLAAGCGKKQEVAPAEVVRPVKTFVLGGAGEARMVEFPGVTQAIKEALLAFEVSGRIAELPVKEGDVVNETQLLAQLDQTQFKANLDAAVAQKKATEATLKRYANAAKTGAVSEQDLEIANRNDKVALAKLVQAQKDFDDTTLKADFDGVVAKVRFERFENVVAKQEVLLLQDTSKMKVKVDIPESRMARADPDVSLEEFTRRVKPVVELTALPGRRFPAEITEAAQTADPKTRTYEATVVFSPPDDETGNIRVLPGMTAKVIGQSTAGPGSNAFRVPSNAIGTSPGGGAFLWRVDPKAMTIGEVPVTLGEPGGSMIEVSGELKEGDEIVISGVRQLQAGTKVSRWEGSDSSER